MQLLLPSVRFDSSSKTKRFVRSCCLLHRGGTTLCKSSSSTLLTHFLALLSGLSKWSARCLLCLLHCQLSSLCPSVRI